MWSGPFAKQCLTCDNERMNKIKIYLDDEIYKVVEAENGRNLLELLQENDLPVNAVCGGNGTCGKCLVGLTRSGRGAGKKETVLACQTAVTGDCEVSVRRESGGVIEGSTPGTGGLGTGRSAGPEGAGTGDSGRAAAAPDVRVAAVDLGTTTIAVRIFDPERPGEDRVLTDWNRQRTYGADVISRIQYIMENEGGLDKLSSLIGKQIIKLAEEGGSGRPEKIFIAGNTVMEHIAAGLSPVSIASAPFTPETLFMDDGAYDISGIPAYFAPCAAGYVGGDIMAGLYASGICDRPGNYLYLDIGTNGEMAVVKDGSITCCAVASGPAFEGAGISCGMASTPGAVNHVKWADGSLSLAVIGDGAPEGICGSGLLDLAAVLADCRVVDGYGRLLPPDELDEAEGAEFWQGHVTEDENGNGLLHLADSLSFTAADVRQLQLAKAAVAAGIEILLEKNGLGPDDIDQAVLAGGFGTHLDPESAIGIGMLPAELSGKIKSVGNLSLAGISGAAGDPSGRTMAGMRELADKCSYLELSGNDEFNDAYIEHMSFYEEDF